VFLPYRFPGKERDSESGNDYFEARYFASSMGRMLSPDPLGGSLANPQSLNKYAYALNNPLVNTDPTGLYVCKDSADCSSQQDKDFEAARQHDLQSKNADVVRGAPAYGDVNAKNGTTVGFADLGKSGEGGITTSHLGTDENGNLQAQTSVTLNSNDKAGSTALQADVGHEGSHAADAQDMVKSISIDNKGNFKVGDDISAYRSEQRAYGVTDAIYRSANEPYSGCASDACKLGAETRGQTGRSPRPQAQHPAPRSKRLACSPPLTRQ
jgi:RHS repeat-associated protein